MHRRITSFSLAMLLIFSFVGNAGVTVANYSTGITTSAVQAATSSVGGRSSSGDIVTVTAPQASTLTPPGPPCLAPSSAYPNAPVRPSSSDEPMAGSIVPPVQDASALQVGSVSPSKTIQLELVFSIKNLKQFQACLDSIQNPQSPNYLHFLNATTLAPYLPTPGERSSAVSFLSHAGFSVSDGASPLVLRLKGTVGTAESAFGLRFGLFQHGSSRFFASASNPSLPRNLAQITAGIIGLNNYTTARPSETPCGYQGSPHCPQGVQLGYSMNDLYSSGYNGAGVTVAVVDAPGDPSPQRAIDTFDSQYGLPPVTLKVLYPDGVPSKYDPGWASETAMDIEAVHSMAPGAGITLVYGNSTSDLLDAIDYVATNRIASIVSNSWSFGPEARLSPSDVESVDYRLMVDASQGLTILFPSGDSGAFAGGSLGVDFPSSDPNVLSVGATSLYLAGCTRVNCTRYGVEVGASISGGGVSGYFSEPSWQTAALGTLPGRVLPDVSALGYRPNFWVYSTYAGGPCSPGGKPGPGWFDCAGTSLSTPLWAGFLAVALQVGGRSSFGNVDPLIYAIGSSASYHSVFHDILAGSNGAYSAGPRWDPVTGWGSPIGSALAKALAFPWAIELPTFQTDVTVYSNSCPGTLSGCTVPGSDSTSWSNRIYELTDYTGTVGITVTNGEGDCCHVGDYYSLWQTNDLSGLSGWTELGITQQVHTGVHLKAPSFNPYWTGDGTKYSSTTFFTQVNGPTLFAVRDELLDSMVTLLGPSCSGPLVVVVGCDAPGVHVTQDWSPTSSYTISFVSGGSSGVLSGGGTSWPAAEGVTVTLTGSSAPEGTAATLAIEDLFGSKPVGTGETGLTDPVFYDVRITGISDGMTNVCVTDSSITPAVIIEYYDGTQWAQASAHFSPPHTDCADIPVSALRGTLLALGPPVSPSIFLNPSSGATGTQVGLSGFDLASGHTITAAFDGSSLTLNGMCVPSSLGDLSDCGFTVPPSAIGPHTVTVSDDTNTPTATFTVTPETTTSTTTLSGGSATVDQISTTGTRVMISGSTASDGTNVTVNSQDWGIVQPPGTGSVSLGSTSFFGIQTLGISYGTGRVCITSARVTSATVMQYWDAARWIGAASQTVTGTTICGGIPVSVLRGTSVVLGTLSASTGEAVVTLSCAKAAVVVGTGSSCKATVRGSRPTGTVTWSNSSSVVFSKPTCKLSKGACSVKFTPTVAGSSVVLAANYGGDSKNSPSVGTFILTVSTKASKTEVSCTPRSAGTGPSTTITCKAKVTGYSPTGTVKWSQSGTGSVSFTSTACALFKRMCSVTMTGSTSGSVNIIASYLGDSNNQGSSRTAKLVIK